MVKPPNSDGSKTEGSSDLPIAGYWRREGNGFRCELCFRRCFLTEGQSGFCGVRQVENNIFKAPLLGRFCSLAIEPIEKKPLYHWRPKSSILSLGSLGCTMNCPFCQNHDIARPESEIATTFISPQALAAKARDLGQQAVAYTYNEPTLQTEYILKAAPWLNEFDVRTVLVTNGQMSAEAANALASVVAAANIDLKSFNRTAYSAMGGSSSAVKGNIVLLAEKGVHVEVTTLVVPGLSDNEDDFANLVDWLAELSPDIPFHISRYFPAYQYSAPSTDLNILHSFQKIAQSRLRHVHLGNVR